MMIKPRLHTRGFASCSARRTSHVRHAEPVFLYGFNSKGEFAMLNSPDDKQSTPQRSQQATPAPVEAAQSNGSSPSTSAATHSDDLADRRAWIARWRDAQGRSAHAPGQTGEASTSTSHLDTQDDPASAPSPSSTLPQASVTRQRPSLLQQLSVPLQAPKAMPLKPSQALSNVSALFSVASFDEQDSSGVPVTESNPHQQHIERIIVDALATIDPQCFEDLPREIGRGAAAGATIDITGDAEHTELEASNVRSFNYWVQPAFFSTPAFTEAAPHAAIIATQVSLDRWQNFVDLAHAWGGPISVCVYIPAPCNSEEARACEVWLLRQITHVMADMKPNTALSVQTLYSTHRAREGRGLLPEVPLSRASNQISYNHQYPINALRNVALDACRSHLVAVIDADFIPSRDLHEHLRNAVGCYHGREAPLPDNPLVAPVAQSLAFADQLREGLALVVPAFQTPQQMPLARMPRTRKDLRNAGAVPFGCLQDSNVDQMPTNHSKWWQSDEAYSISWQPGYEPFAIYPRCLCPRFDERFRGYGYNKVQHTRESHALGHRFKVLPHHFLVTAPHAKSDAWRAANIGARPYSQLVKDLYELFEQELVCLAT